ncbi:MAG: PIN domain-containing protein [Sulfuricellaceae bacterium]
MRVVIDASVLISAFKENEPEHSASADFLEAAVARSFTLCSPALLFPEIAGAFARPARNPEYAEQVIREIRALLGIKVYTLRGHNLRI